ncbi:MAG: hypothetical protein V3T05_05490 [Myxococcota bacterium]
MSQATALQTDDGSLDAATFFESMLPAILEQRAALAASVRGSICFIVHGQGSWLVKLGPDACVEPELDLDADLVATFSVDTFGALLAGEPLDADCGEPVCLGDCDLLEKFGRLLVEPLRGVVAARLACA